MHYYYVSRIAVTSEGTEAVRDAENDAGFVGQAPAFGRREAGSGVVLYQ